MNREKSQKAYCEALRYIPGGVNSPVRALRNVGETPLFIQKAKGCRLTDIDGNHFTDFCLSWGVFILGHGAAPVNKAVKDAIAKGTSYGIPSLQETELARLVNQYVPSMEKTRFVNSGTEAVMSAVRLARGYTGRNTVVKFDGCYHGHADHLLVSAGSGVADLVNSSSAGVPDGFVAHTVSVPFNDKDAVRRMFEERSRDIAAVIVEPVPANMGVVLPQDDFLQYLREITVRNGALLIFDEVITGFRLSTGGAQKIFGITPDLTTVGKIAGGGFPAAAFGGRADIMSLLAPDGPVYQAGTLSGNPVAMSAGIATLNQLSADGFYTELNGKSEMFVEKLKRSISGKDITLNYIGNMFTLFFTPDKVVHSFEDAKKSDRQRFARFFRYMLSNGFYISPSQFEANFISVSHSRKELDRFAEAVGGFRE
ncbi:MAG: glutamate-1-semialdehyde 2,1-aminomutase [Tannerella sp.]|jgi:glutamate-1-semialdehyde 2,1-aminomutase|nr:glutamate-1-semialdehyde 2,1-aminomutase [Tannerella sp.]